MRLNGNVDPASQLVPKQPEVQPRADGAQRVDTPPLLGSEAVATAEALAAPPA